MLLRVVPETAYRPPTRFQNSLTPCVHQAVSPTFFQVFAALSPHAFFLTAYRTGATVRCALTAFSNLAPAGYRTLCARTHARPAGLTDAMCAYAIGHNRPAPLTPHCPTRPPPLPRNCVALWPHPRLRPRPIQQTSAIVRVPQRRQSDRGRCQCQLIHAFPVVRPSVRTGGHGEIRTNSEKLANDWTETRCRRSCRYQTLAQPKKR